MKRLILLVVILTLVSGCGDGSPTSNNAAESISDSRDGNTYRAIKMPDGRVWMAQNLNIKIDNSWCYHDSDSYCKKYGRLYDWETAKIACPEGWRLPSYQEWTDLASAIGGYETAGKKLKAKKGWYDYHGVTGGNGTDEYGFSALPGGRRNESGNFYDVDSFGLWWVNRTQGTGNAYRRGMNSRFDNLDEHPYPVGFGFSIRCIKG